MSARDLLANATPLPWAADLAGTIRMDARGSVYIDTADAALIVAAVNEYGPLLDIADAARAFEAEHFASPLRDALARLDTIRSDTA